MYQYQEPKLHFGPSSPLEFKDGPRTRDGLTKLDSPKQNLSPTVVELVMKTQVLMKGRTHDKKLTGGDCLFVQSSGGQLLIGALKLFENLPQSIKGRYELEMEYSNNDSDGSVDEDEFGIMTLEGLDDEMESLLWSDEILWETPLDKVDSYKEFYKVMKCIKSSNKPMMIESELGVITVWVWLMAVGDEWAGQELLEHNCRCPYEANLYFGAYGRHGQDTLEDGWLASSEACGARLKPSTGQIKI
ncbi:hypothetical protein PPACK8108_LOCUS14476 [Phakopsora pachyrhizi]|uniref:Uncharacterized protein n=1 Tax=Phakopsora pachyrhizi TaxID=170000 RepID=A0AAV0B7E2_PHAPC|nr:hypothetical protein PPACK8108_LOCUS14476 [Phakopsora pachyrhizi]